MALGDVERTCDAGACTARAAFIGSFTDQLQQRQTRAACNQEHVVEVERYLRGEGFKVTWSPFPPRPKVTELGGQHAPTQA
jgi:hypothetical protein